MHPQKTPKKNLPTKITPRLLLLDQKNGAIYAEINVLAIPQLGDSQKLNH